MKKYEPGDIITCYFVVYDDGEHKTIRGWTDNKEYAKIYMDFHHCKHYRIKKITDVSTAIYKIIEENINDEILLFNINTKGKNNKSVSMVIPMTNSEKTLVNEESNTLVASRVNYGYINEAMHYLTDKYQKALKMILLDEVIKSVVYSKESKILDRLEIDDLMVLFHSFPDQFG